MSLVGLRGSSADASLLIYALEHAPSLVIDCSNAANPHAFFPFVNFEKFKQVFVVQAELIYTYRDVFKEIPKFAKEVGTKTIIVTTSHRVFNYQDEKENSDIFRASWARMKELSKDLDLFVGVHRSQEHFARQYCDRIEEVKDGAHRLEPTTKR